MTYRFTTNKTAAVDKINEIDNNHDAAERN